MIPLFVALLVGCTPDERAGPDHPPGHQAPSDSADTSESADTADSAETGDTSGTKELGCGDDVIDGPHEECDGAADDACPDRCATTCQCPSMPASDSLELDMIDVWQGDGLLLISPAGFVTLLDAGDEAAFPAVRDFLDSRGIPGLDYTLVSHQHADHMGAMDLVLKAHPEVGIAWDGGGTATSQSYTDYVAAAGNRRTPVVKGELLALGPETTAEVIHTDVGNTENENLNSVVVRLTYGTVHLMLGGDCEFQGCERGLDPGPIDIYKVDHHGSSDSSGWAYLQAMQPSVALISVGLGNDYGHPEQQVLTALGSIGADIWRTDEDGTISVVTDGATWSVTSEKR